MRESAALVAALLVACCGCGKGPIPGEDVTVTSKGGGEAVINVKTKGKEGDAQITVGKTGSVSLPADFPKDVPIQEGATVATTMRMGDNLTVTLTLKGTLAATKAYYEAQLKKEGWTVEQTMEMGTSSMISAKKDKRECALVIGEDKGTVSIMITLPKEGR
jgi:hypothetical protein